jgi:hypothetical protein
MSHESWTFADVEVQLADDVLSLPEDWRLLPYFFMPYNPYDPPSP